MNTKTTTKLITLWLPLVLPDIFSVFDILTTILVTIKLRISAPDWCALSQVRDEHTYQALFAHLRARGFH